MHCWSPVAELYEKCCSPISNSPVLLQEAKPRSVAKYSSKSSLTPYPEVAGPVRVLIGDFINEIVFLALLDSVQNDKSGLGVKSIIQLDEVEVAIVNGLNVSFIAKVVVSLLIGIFKKVEASPLPVIRIILQVIARYLKLFRQVATASRAHLGIKHIGKIGCGWPASKHILRFSCPDQEQKQADSHTG